jgi:hypothetical protein
VQCLNVTAPGDTVIERILAMTLTVAFVLALGFGFGLALLTAPIPTTTRTATINMTHTLPATVLPSTINEAAANGPSLDPQLQAGRTERQHGRGKYQ